MPCIQTNFTANEVSGLTRLRRNPQTNKAFIGKDHLIAATLISIGIAVMIALCGGSFAEPTQTPTSASAKTR